MADVALCVFATGRYAEFLPSLVDSAKRFFLIGHSPHVVVFSDGLQNSCEVTVQVPHLSWPKPTLYRYRWLAATAGVLRNYRWLFMCDADMMFASMVGDEILGDLVATRHQGHTTKPLADLPYERRPLSRAFVPQNVGKAYYAGGFQGGATGRYLQVAALIDYGIIADEREGVLATWHDESHWNCYLARNPPTIELPPTYCCAEIEPLPGAKITALVKHHPAYRKP